MLYIHGMGHFHPENLLDNQFLEDLDIGTNQQWIVERVGIKSRRTVLDLDYIRQTKNKNLDGAREASTHSNAQTGAKAAKLAIKRAGLQVSDIGMVIAGGSAPQYTIPGDGPTIACELELEVPSFDLNTACSSFAFILDFINNMVPKTMPDYILVVNAENNTRVIDYSDRNAAVLIGDATSAVVVSTKIASNMVVQSSVMSSNPLAWNKVVIPTGRHFIQSGSAVQKFAIKKTGELIKSLDATFEDERSFFIGHQANLLMLNSVCERANIPAKQHLFNVDQFGNGSAAGGPSNISQNWDTFKAGDNITLAVVGGGLTWAGLKVAVS